MPDPARTRLTRDALGIGVAVGTYGLSFGAIATSAGLSVAQACALSLLAFTGASQFALVGVLGGGGGAAAGVATALLLGSRNALYGVRLAGTLRLAGWRRAVGAQVVIDETTAMTLAQPDPADARRAFWLTAAAVYGFWNVATVVGAYAGAVLSDPRVLGLDAAVPAAFLALLWPRLAGRPERAVAAGAVAVAVALTPVTPVGVPVLAAAGVALARGVRR